MAKITEQPLTKSLLAEIKELRLSAKERKSRSAFILEGLKLAKEFLDKNASISHIVYDIHKAAYDDEIHQLISLAHARGIPCYSAPSGVFAKASTLHTPQGIMAVAKVPSGNLKAILETSHFLLCVGNGIQDPTNVGLLVRTAAAFGVNGIILTEDSADAFGPKAVRASSGAVLDIPIFYSSVADLIKMKGSDICFYGALPRAAKPIEDIRAIEPKSALVLGNEGKGISEDLAIRIDVSFTIPIAPTTESLNVAAAGAIALYHFSTLAHKTER